MSPADEKARLGVGSAMTKEKWLIGVLAVIGVCSVMFAIDFSIGAAFGPTTQSYSGFLTGILGIAGGVYVGLLVRKL